MSPEMRNLNDMVIVLANAMAAKDPYTANHKRRAAQIAGAIDQEIGADPEFIEGVRVIGLVHDLGKIAI